MDDETRDYPPPGDDAGRRTGRFGFVEPDRFDPQPPPVPPGHPSTSGATRRRPEGAGRRFAALAIVGVALLVAIAFEGPTRRPGAAEVTTTTEPPPVAVQVGSGEKAPKAFYCPEGSTTDGTEEIILLVNTAKSEITARLTFLVSGANPPSVPVKVPPGTRQNVRVNDLVQAQGVGTLVEADAPGLAVAETLYFDTPTRKGTLSGPCPAQVATRWYFAGGTTARGYELWMLLVNPFPEDAVVNVVSVADGEEVKPPEFQQVPVPARSRVSLPLHNRILRKDRVATTVSATRGRVAAAQSVFLTDEPRGAALLVGATAPSSTWLFGDSLNSAGVTSTISVFNVGDEDVSARVDLLLSGGVAPPPQSIKVPGRGRTDLVVGAELPPDTSFAVRLTSTGRVVASRSVLAQSPSPRRGYLVALGAVAPHRSWIVPEAAAEPPYDALLSVTNPGAAPARIRVGSLAGGTLAVPANVAAIDVAPGTRLPLTLREYFSGLGLSLVVDSDQPVVVESVIHFTSPRYGSTASSGVPVDGSLPFTPVALPAKPPPTTAPPPPAPGSTVTAAPGSTPSAAPPAAPAPDPAPSG